MIIIVIQVEQVGPKLVSMSGGQKAIGMTTNQEAAVAEAIQKAVDELKPEGCAASLGVSRDFEQGE